MSEPQKPHPLIPRRALTRLPDPLPLVTRQPGCHDCPHWHRVGSAIGECQAPNGPAIDSDVDVRRAGWLTSHAYCCPTHPRFTELPNESEFSRAAEGGSAA
jgi:hypothetical protein